VSAQTRADAFARSLDEGTATAQYPVVGAFAAARTELADRLTPSPAFRARTRLRLLAVAAVQDGAAEDDGNDVRPAVPARRPRRWLRPLATACAGLLVVVAALFGVSVASRDALPGELLYSAKRASEALQLRRADGPLDRGITRLHLAEERLAEVRELIGGQALGGQVRGGGVLAAGADSELIRSTLQDMDTLTRTGSGLVLQVVQDTGDLAPLTVLLAWTRQQAERLGQVAPSLPPAARTQLVSSVSLVTGLAARTADLLGPD
jgi:hypothetical protein